MKKQPKVLLVDDEPEFVNSLMERLQLRDVEPHTAGSGEEAIEMARKEKFHVAIVDLKMPGLDGLATISKLKEIQPKIHTCLLTAYGDEKVRQASEALDSEYFDKGEMTSFWSFIKRLPSKFETAMTQASFAEHGDWEDAKRVAEEDDDN